VTTYGATISLIYKLKIGTQVTSALGNVHYGSPMLFCFELPGNIWMSEWTV